jgi:hypothetical protein
MFADGGMTFTYELKVQHDYPYKNIANRWLQDNPKDSLKYKLAILIMREKKDPDEILGIKDDSQYARLLRSLEKAKGESKHEMSWRQNNYSLSEAEKWTRDSLRDMFYVHSDTTKMAHGGITEHGLMVGDMIVGTSADPYSIVVRNNGMESIVDLNEGTRMSNNQGTRFASRTMKDPMVVRTQFEEMEFEFADGGMMADGGRITKGAKYMTKYRTTNGDSGYSILEVVDTNYFSNKYGGSPNTIRTKVIESSHEKVGSFDENSRKQIQSNLKNGFWTKLDNYAEGGAINDFGGTTYSTVSPATNTSFVFSSDSTGTSWVFTNNAYVNV